MNHPAVLMLRLGPREALLLTLRQEGPLEETTLIPMAKRLFQHEYESGSIQIEALVEERLVVRDGTVRLTPEGESAVDAILVQFGDIGQGRVAVMRRTWVLSLLVDVGMLVSKLGIGLATGSLALLVDAGDHAVAAISQGSLHREGGHRRLMAVAAILAVVVIFLGGLCAITVWGNPIDDLMGVSDRPSVIVMSLVAAAISLALFGYHRFVASRTGSMAILSRGNHHRDHAAISMMVAVITWLSMNDTPVLDPLMGLFISLWMVFGAVMLWREARRPRDGHQVDMMSMIGKADRKWGSGTLLPYRKWLMTSLRKKGQPSEDLARMMSQTFPSASMPILWGGSGRGLDLEADFDSIIRPMLKSRLLVVSQDELLLSPIGRKFVRYDLKCQRHMRRW